MASSSFSSAADVEHLLTPSSLSTHLDSLTASSSSSGTARATAYTSLFTHLLSLPRSKLSPTALPPLADAYLEKTAFAAANSSGGGLVVGRQVLAEFDKAIQQAAEKGKDKKDDAMNVDGDDDDDPAKPAILDLETRREIVQNAVEKLQSRVSIFEEQVTSLRFHLCTLLEGEEDWLEAARALQGINLESSNRALNDFTRLETYIRIARLHLESDDPVQADVFLKRASHLLSIATDAAKGDGGNYNEEERGKAKVLLLSYKLCQARIYDSQRRFLDAATRFHELSYVVEIDDEERMQMLSAAVTAGILSPAGPNRSRVLSSLIKDERTNQLPQRTILSKVFLDHIVRPQEIAEFEKLLAPHQTAAIVPSANDKAMFALADEEEGIAAKPASGRRRHGPSTVLDRAMMEHNILATSRLYRNITFNQGGLSTLLDVSPLGAETIARRMIQQKRLRAEIDQTAGLLTFSEDAKAAGSLVDSGEMTSNVAASAAAASSSADAAGGPGGAGGEEEDEEELDPDAVFTKRWDAHIAKTAGTLEDVYQRLLKAEMAAKTSAPMKA